MSVALAAIGPADDLFGSGCSPGALDLYSFDEAEQSLLCQMARRMALDWISGALIQVAEFVMGMGGLDEEGTQRRGKPRLTGIGMRALVFAWSVLPSMHGLRQTELAELVGLNHKQSLGRKVSEFRDRFPTMVWGTMQTEQAREACRQREARKVKVSFAEEESFQVQIDFQI